ncbi:MAG: hypothetical protein FWG40_11635 [Peptococcaceae bacterium]|nr:hypothetical protein [Peptococcaceae bacterium]
MKKKMIVMLIVVTLSLAMALPAYADTATSVVSGPSLTTSGTQCAKSSTYSLTPGPSGNIPKGSKSYTFFSSYSSLSTGFTAVDRGMDIFLMKSDGITVKTYTAKIVNRKLSSVTLFGTSTSGNLSTNGTAKLYLCAHLKAKTGDTAKTNAKLFNFQIGINS